MVNILVIVFTMSLIYVVSAGRLETYIRVLALQGFLLFGIAFFELQEMSPANLLFILFETLLFKGIIVPFYLNQVINKNNIRYERDPDKPNFYSLLKISFIILGSVLISYQLHEQHLDILDFTASLSAIFTGVLIVTRRKKIITHVIGYLILDNGIFLLSLSVGNHMPFIINISILFDVLVEVVLLGIFITKVSDVFHDTQIENLAELKD